MFLSLRFFLFLLSIVIQKISSKTIFNAPTSECVITVDNTCSFKTIHTRTSIYPGGNTRCIFDTNSSLNLNSTYRFEVIPGKGDKRNQILLQFQGGGGCFNKDICDEKKNKIIESFTGSQIFTTNSLSSDLVGVLDQDNQQNPFKDWTIVSIIYCTGDIHSGNTTLQADQTIHFNGANNVESVLKWVYTNFPLPKQIVLSGYSAGSLAASIWSNRIVKDYKKMGYKGSFKVIMDGFLGYFPISHMKLFPLANICSANLYFPQDILNQCKNGTLEWKTINNYIFKANPDVTFAYTSSKRDNVQLYFYCILLHERLSFDINEMTECITSNELYKGAIQLLQSYRKTSSNLLIYLIDGNYHCNNNNKRFYTVQAGPETPLLVDWIRNIIQEKDIRSYCVSNNTITKDLDCESYNSLDQYSNSSSYCH